MNITETNEILTTFASMVRLRLRHHLRILRTNEAAYRADVDDWYTNGDGRSPEWIVEYDDEGNRHAYNAGGSGYSYPHCIHGMSRWTDYDNICGGCEDGTPNREIALVLAQNDVLAWNERMKWVQTAPQGLPREVLNSLWEWTMEPLS